MVVINGYYKKYIHDLIQVQPTILTHSTTIRTPDGYNGYTTTQVDTEITARLYKNGKSLTIIQESGQIQGGSGVSIKALCEGDPAISEGDTLKDASRQYRVDFVQRYFGVCTQLELDVIK